MRTETCLAKTTHCDQFWGLLMAAARILPDVQHFLSTGQRENRGKRAITSYIRASHCLSLNLNCRIRQMAKILPIADHSLLLVSADGADGPPRLSKPQWCPWIDLMLINFEISDGKHVCMASI